MNPIIRGSQLRINPGQLADINNTLFGCPALDIALNCTGGHLQTPQFSQNLQVVSSTNWKPRMSTGLELQVFLPIVNAPFRVYWAYNPLRLGQYHSRPGAYYARHVPAGSSGRLHLPAGVAQSGT
jgi:outer membrane protein insertion porin family